ncbi:polyketide synthase dehydratase domain-containing protein [Streptomyces sp. NBC_00124]|uniref:beta-ketoacyl synthase N-terminal-like domain-containing protein n=1 Tax=Streptomyces sp. NBC_00124 TaxID=2975662 RepID=UPI002252B8B2|nr:beta-ketoacyl synthase N-terminal-like domain-containing protein [Streptomyces sp. NBC_00124]MCX5359785.1 polyketide synthase dehydratase domain-containing protein [Streptomyces sp. NBC_00124]
MTDDALLRRSLDAVRALREQVGQLRARTEEPIAVVGLGCRFPGGADSPERYWDLLREGRDGITDVPADRWPDDRWYSPDRTTPGTSYTRRGGFLTEGAHAFDASFFGIPDAEARELDPQHRLLLEASWQALEHAGLVSGTRAEQRVGVFVGISGSENALRPRPLRDTGPYTATGSAISVAAGRVAHTLGLRGPALAVDTACSSSLLAVHLAVESLRRGECAAAVAGGVSAMMSPAVMVALSRMEALSEDGRCKVFDVAADGYARAEGCGMVALMRAGDAAAVRAPVLALITGSAVNHDGRTSGLTVPNGRAQRELITEALRTARTDPQDVDYLEAHGTGTPLGDPIEVRAAADVLCAGRTAVTPLRIGAVKSNVGHLEAAAGVAGLIKTVLALRHREIPGNLHLRTPNPRLGVERLPVVLNDRTSPWPDHADGRARTAGVSSFGFSGTNVHVVLTEPAAAPRRASGPDRPAHVLALSARDPEGLRDAAARLGDWLAHHPEATLADVCHTTTARRAHFAHRAALVTASRDELAGRLAALAAGGAPEMASGGRQLSASDAVGARDRAPTRPVAFLLDADADRAANVVAALHPTHPGFRAHYDECAAELATAAGADPAAAAASGHLSSTLEADVLTVACQVALVRTLADWGLAPGAVAAGNAPGDLAAGLLGGALGVREAGSLLGARHTAAPAPTALPRRAPALRLLHGPDATEVTADQVADPAFWTRTATGTSARAAAGALTVHGYDTLIHIGGAAAAEDPSGVWRLPGDDIWRELLDGLAHRHIQGDEVDWSAFDDGYDRTRLDLPGQVFRRRAYRTAAAEPDTPAVPGTGAPVGTLGLRALPSPLEQRQFTATVSRALLPEVADTAGVVHVGYHQDMLASVAPADGGLRLSDVTFEQALTLSGTRERAVHLVVGPPDGDGWSAFSVHSRAIDEPATADEPGSWRRHAGGRVRTGPTAEDTAAAPEPLTEQARAAIKERCAVRIDGADFYRRLSERGVPYGPSVEWVTEAWLGDGEILARLRAPSGEETHGGPGRPAPELPVPPGVLDACAPLYALAAERDLHERDLFMVAGLGEAGFGARTDGPLWCHVRLTAPATRQSLVGDHLLGAEDGRTVGWARATEIRVIGSGGPAPDAPPTDATRARWRGPAGHAALRSRLARMVGELLQLPPEDVPFSLPLSETGLDSLAALELRRRVRAEAAVDLPVDLLIAGPTLDEVLDRVTASVEGHPVSETRRPYDTDSARWLPAAPRDDCAVRVFCLPYGGRGASLYRGWAAAADPAIDVCPVQLPGREERGDERPLDTVEEAVEAVAQAIEPYLDRPFALYGHSMGALLAFRLAHRLEGKYSESLRHLFVSAFSAPTGRENPLGARLRSVTRGLGFTGMPDHEDLMRLRRAEPERYRDALRTELGEDLAGMAEVALDGAGYADLRIVESYRHDLTEPPLHLPVTAFHGTADPVVREPDARAWRTLTTGDFELLVLPGDHYFVHGDQSGPRVLTELTHRLRAPHGPTRS